MTPIRNRHLILNYIFIGCLIVLILNDHFFKYEYANWITGKLSDAVGIIMLPLLLAYLFPALRYHSIWICAIVFTFWKSPLSTTLIEAYNQVAPIQINRVIDYTDLLVFFLLPVPYFIIGNINNLHALVIKKIHPVFVLIPVMVGFMATSLPIRSHFYQHDGQVNLYCSDCYITINYPPDEIQRRLREDSINLYFEQTQPITHPYGGYTLHTSKRYVIDELVIDGDTLRDISFDMTPFENKTIFQFQGLRVNHEMSEWRLAKTLAKLYKKKIFRELRAKIED